MALILQLAGHSVRHHPRRSHHSDLDPRRAVQMGCAQWADRAVYELYDDGRRDTAYQGVFNLFRESEGPMINQRGKERWKV